jgi:EmrB/QacA subfamily drug resistance transporter
MSQQDDPGALSPAPTELVPGSESGRLPPVGPARHVPDWLLLTVVCVGQFMVVLDISIVNVALPSMQRDLGFSTSALQWVVNAYALTFAGFLLLGGRAGDLYGRRRMFLVGLLTFAGASLVCAVAQDQAMLIGARALQGLGGAILSPATLTILTTEFTEPRKRARALGVWSAMAAAGGASGALLGGVLTDLLTWRWIFLINVPIGIVTAIGARTVLQESRRADADARSLDVLGALTVTGGLVLFVYAVAATSWHPWGSVDTLVPLFASFFLLGAFVVVETRVASAPLVPFRIFRSRSLSGANVSMLALGAAMFPMWLFLSLYLQEVLGFSPLKAGFGFLPQTLAIVVGAQVSSRLVPRVGPRLPLLVGTLMAAVGLFWLAHLQFGQSYWTVAAPSSTLATLGMGLSFTPLAFAATTGVAPQEAGLASGLLNTSRQMGGSIGLAVLVTLATTKIADLRAAGAHTASAVAAANTSGYDRGLAVGALFALLAAAASLVLPRNRAVSFAGATGPPEEVREAAPEVAPALAIEPEG